ncbi:MAG: hypothetical protein PSX71_04480 [bacterium]|nr:hypothetical protein [bacterium]
MFRALKTLLLAAGLAASFAHAADAPSAGRAPVKDTDNLYVGVGLFNDMLNANLEAVTGWGNFMLRFGRFKEIDTGAAANISWRKPLEGGSGHDSGYYIGVFAGQVMGDTLATKTFQRVGGGAEMGYHWVDDYTRAEVTVGIGSAQPEEAGGKRLEAVPTMFFNFNMALGY